MWGLLTNMVSTRRSSRLQEKQVAASAPASPTPSATASSPTTRRVRSATKASPPSATRARRTTPTKSSPAKRGRPRKNAATAENESEDASATQSDVASDQLTDRGSISEDPSTAKELFTEEAETKAASATEANTTDAGEPEAPAPQEEEDSGADNAETEPEPELAPAVEAVTDETESEPEVEGIEEVAEEQPQQEEAVEEEEIVMMDSSDDEEDGAEEAKTTNANDDADEDEEDEDEDMDIAAFAKMAAAAISFTNTSSSSNSTQASAKTGRHLVPDTLDSGASSRTKFLEFEGTKQGLGAKVVAATASAEEQKVLAHQLGKVAKAHRQRSEAQNVASAGRKWFDMSSHELDADARRDFALLKMRNYLDPKKFYKTSDHTKKMPKHFQFGTVIEGAHEFKSARLTKKERQQTFTDEIMADDGVRSYTKRVFLQVQNKRAGGQGKKKKQKRY